MAIFSVGGWLWSPDLVGWGKVGGGGSKCEMKGYHSARLDSGNGRLTVEQRERQTLDVWGIPAVYALYRDGRLIYVGKATALGDRLFSHHKRDHLVGRWNAFSWVSPVCPVEQGDTLAWPGALDTSSVSIPPDVDGYLREVEAFAALIGAPVENRQQQNIGDHFWWLEQVRSDHAEKSDKEKLDFVYRLLAKNSKEEAG